MQKSNQYEFWSYDIIAKSLHWILAILLIGMIALGRYMVSIKDEPNSARYFALHKSFGLIVATLVLLRLIWRLSHRPAPLPTSVPFWQATVARAIHWLLYICMVLMPLTGFLGASFSPYGVSFFGLQLPSWVGQNQKITEQFFNLHGLIAWVLVVLVLLHILAALKHLFINKDNVFWRMW